MKIVIIGGHHISALVLAKYLKEKHHQIYWFGTRYPRWPEKTEGIEYRQVRAENLAFIDLKTGKFHQNFWRWWRILFGFFQATWYLLKLKPDLIFSFGGYLAVPVVIGGWLLAIPSITHEQTRTAGLANRFLQYFVKKICLTWPESKKFFKGEKTILTGLPIRKELFSQKKIKLFKNNLPVILVMGGKQGSHSINLAIREIIAELLLNYNVVHQCGDILKAKDYDDLTILKKSLPKPLRERYLLHKFFGDRRIAEILIASDLVVSRAGAHIIYELALLGKPAIFIPLPFSFAKEQLENAKLFTQNKAGIIINQEQLKGEFLFRKIQEMFNKINYYQGQAQKLKKLVLFNAVSIIANLTEKFLNEKKI